MQHLMMMHQQQGAGLQIGIATPQNMYNSATKLSELLGFKATQKYWTDPSSPDHPPVPNPMQGQLQIEQMKIQAMGQNKQMEIQAQGQTEQLKAQATAQIEQMKAQLQAQLAEADRAHEAQLEQNRAQMQMQVDMNKQQAQGAQRQQELQQEAQLAQMQQEIDAAKHQAEQAMSLEIEKIKARAQIIVAKIGANEAESPDELAGETNLFTDATSPADEIRAQLALALDGFQQAIQSINRPKQIVRDQNGRATGIQ